MMSTRYAFLVLFQTSDLDRDICRSSDHSCAVAIQRQCRRLRSDTVRAPERRFYDAFASGCCYAARARLQTPA